MRVYRCAKRIQPIYSYIQHYHSYWEVVFQLEGTAKTQLGSEEWMVEPGDILVIPPFTPHSGESKDGFRDIFFIVENMDFSIPMQLHDYDGSISILMEMMQKLFLDREGNYLAIADSLCETIQKYLQKFSAQPERYPFVAELKNRIYRELSNPDFSVSQEIHDMGFHPDYVRRCFQEEEGKTPLEYLTERRINKARELLLHDPFYGVEYTASQCGFSDSFYFSRKFKQVTGVSPSQYRKENLVRNEMREKQPEFAPDASL